MLQHRTALHFAHSAPCKAANWLCSAAPQDPRLLPELAHVLPTLGAAAIKMQAQKFSGLMQKAAAAQVRGTRRRRTRTHAHMHTGTHTDNVRACYARA